MPQRDDLAYLQFSRPKSRIVNLDCLGRNHLLVNFPENNLTSFLNRICVQQLHTDRAPIMLLTPLYFKCFFGRFFNLEMISYELILLNSFLGVFLDIGVKLVWWNRSKARKIVLFCYPSLAWYVKYTKNCI